MRAHAGPIANVAQPGAGTTGPVVLGEAAGHGPARAGVRRLDSVRVFGDAYRSDTDRAIDLWACGIAGAVGLARPGPRPKCPPLATGAVVSHGRVGDTLNLVRQDEYVVENGRRLCFVCRMSVRCGIGTNDGAASSVFLGLESTNVRPHAAMTGGRAKHG